MLLLAAVVVAVLAARYTSPLRLVENRLADATVTLLSPPRPPSQRLVVVTITDATLAGLPYRSPLDRALLSEVLTTLQAKGVRVIGLDVLLDRPTEPRKDALLRSTMATLDVPVVLAALGEEDGIDAVRAGYLGTFAPTAAAGLAIAYRDPLDETVREVLVRRRTSAGERLGFAAAVAQAAGAEVPDGRRLRIDYRVGPDLETPAFPTYPAHQLAELPDAQLRGRIALVGADLDFTGRYRTPFAAVLDGEAGYLPGVGIDAHVVSQILEGRSVRVTSVWQGAALSLLGAVAGWLISIAPVALYWRVAGAALFLPVAWVGAFTTYVYSAILLPLVAPTLAFSVAAILSFARQWRAEYQRRRFIHRAFGQFLSPAVVDQLTREPQRLGLGGESREITFLFTDIQGFTALVERTPPDALVRLLNEYLDEACGIVAEHGGTIDKIVGDALHVMFNAPLLQPDHPRRAVQCALALDEWSCAFIERKAGEGLELGITRIGVNTGVTVVGNFGGARRFDYTAHGDAINTTARLESVNARLGTRVLASAATAERCEGIRFRSIATLVLRGKTDGVAVFEPVAASRVEQPLLDDYEAAYRLLAGDDDEAHAAFRELAARYPHDALIAMHLRRLAAGERGATVVVRRK